MPVQEKKAVKFILSARNNGKSKSVLIFEILKLNFDAKDRTELIDWNSITFTEPPSIAELQGISRFMLIYMQCVF